MEKTKQPNKHKTNQTKKTQTNKQNNPHFTWEEEVGALTKKNPNNYVFPSSTPHEARQTQSVSCSL